MERRMNELSTKEWAHWQAEAIYPHILRTQEVFRVYLNKFEIAITRLFLIIIDLISMNTHSQRQNLYNIRWFWTVSEDELSNSKRLKMLSEMKCSESFSNDFSLRYEVFPKEPIINC